MVGDILRAERENRGLTIKDIERETSIRSLYIDAIEKSDFDSLPSEVYVRGFVKNYAAFLQLNTDYIMQQYREEHMIAVPETTETVQRTGESSGNKEMFASGNDFKERVHKSHRAQNVMIILGLIVCVFVGSIYYFFGEEAKPATVVAEKPIESHVAKPAEKKAVEVKKDVKIEKKTDEKKETKSDVKDNKNEKQENIETKPGAVSMEPGNVTVGAVLSDSCWIQAIADGKTVFEGTAEKGQSFTWAAKEKIIVTVGNAGAVEFTSNGTNIGKAGKVGEVIEKAFIAPSAAGKKKP